MGSYARTAHIIIAVYPVRIERNVFPIFLYQAILLQFIQLGLKEV